MLKRYLENKYTKWYYSIIEKAQARGFPNRRIAKKILGNIDDHHIIPKSIGGTNNRDNMVYLTLREHYIAHRLLIKMTTGDDKSRMFYAFWRMSTTGRYKLSSRTYEIIKNQNARSHSERMSGTNNPFYGKHHSPETVENIKNRNRLYRWSEDTRARMIGKTSGDKNGMFGKNHSDEAKSKMSAAATERECSQETKNKISKSLKGKPLAIHGHTTTCPHCNKTLDLGNAKKHHFDNCKINPDYIPKDKKIYKIKE